MGSATVICSDKTGTLTLNKMTVTQLALNGDFEKQSATPTDAASMQHPALYRELVYAAALCNDASLDPRCATTRALTLTARVKLSATRRRAR